jgi:glycylpeptide N-tetradecanoyltransferase
MPSFWNSQPVNSSFMSRSGKIKELIPNLEPVKLPDNFEWKTLNPHDELVLDQVTDFLQKNYVSDSINKFRLCYSKQFVKWWLTAPDTDPENLILLVHKGLNAIVGLITGVFCDLVIGDQTVKLVDVNFLCLHNKLRQKGFAPLLIQEITRRTVLKGIHVATHTGSRNIFSALGETKYYHRPLQYKRLVKLGFIVNDDNVDDMDDLHQISNYDCESRFVPLEEKHLEQAYEVLTNYLKRYSFHQKMTFEQFKHYFYPDDPSLRVVTSYVALDENGQVEDMISYYSLDSLVLDQKGELVKTIYLFYYSSTSNDLYWMFTNLLGEIKEKKYDVFNITNIMENQVLIDNDLFLEGSGKLKYFMYNWKSELMTAKQIGRPPI